MIKEQENEKVFRVNWNISGIIEVGANNIESARAIVSDMSKKELQDMILEEIEQSFEIGTIEDINVKDISEIFSEMTSAVGKYGEDNVELLVSRENGIFYIHYHDRHDSHPIGDAYAIVDYSEQALIDLENMCNEQGLDFQDM